MIKFIISAMMAVSLSLISYQSLSAVAGYWAQVSRVIIDDTNLGGCAAVTVPGPQVTGLQCGNNFVTFDCDGDYYSKSIAAQKLSGAQLQQVTQGFTRFVVTDDQKHNGYCLVRRLDATNLDAPP